jgi:DNA-binding CsgD family transcriptional regulator
MSSIPLTQTSSPPWPALWTEPRPPGPMLQTVFRLQKEIQKISNPDSLNRMMTSFLQAQGVTLGTYHHLLPFLGAAPFQVSVPGSQFGFPSDYTDVYVRNRWWERDPLLKMVRTRTKPFLFSEVLNESGLTPAEQEIVRFAVAANLGDGYCYPLFGPNGRNGYMGLGAFPIGLAWPDEKVILFGWAAQTTHLRVCEIVEATAPMRPELSARELEILNLIARGKSNAAMAEALGISSYTVDTYLRRLFEKLCVTDRTSAAIRGLVLGLLN